MNIDTVSSIPIFEQIAQELENAIFSGIYEEEAQIPSTNELSSLLNINPQTVLKGMNMLVSGNIIYKKRGVGMFVATGAKEKIKSKRMRGFSSDYVYPMITEAKKLKYTKAQLIEMIEREYGDE